MEESKRELVTIFSDHWEQGKLDFDFEGIAQTLADLAANPLNKPPFTVVVRGDWGRGKTTLLRYSQNLLQQLEKDTNRRNVKTLWFNVWKYPSEDTVLAGILGALLDCFKKDEWKQQLKAVLNANKGKITYTVLRMAAPWLPDKFPKVKFDPINDLTHIVSTERAFHDVFRNLFCQLSHLYVFGSDIFKVTSDKSCKSLWRLNEKNPDYHKGILAIFLDDLDRCGDERVIQVLEAINLFMDVPGVCFFLGIDEVRINKIINNNPSSEGLLEKVVQMSIDIPEVSNKGAEKYINNLLVENEWLKEILGSNIQTLIKILDNRNPRNIKQFINNLSLRLAILENTNNLGNTPPQIPRDIVVTWHLLHKYFPTIGVKTPTSITEFEGLIAQWDNIKSSSDYGEKNQEKSLLKCYQDPVLNVFFEKIISSLDSEQTEILFHLGSPVEEISVKSKSELPTNEKILPEISKEAISTDLEMFKVKNTDFSIAKSALLNSWEDIKRKSIREDIFISIGTSRTRISVRNKGTTLDEPSVILIRQDRGPGGPKKIEAIGSDAKSTYKNNDSMRLQFIYPIANSTIVNSDYATKMLDYFIQKIGANKFIAPRIVTCVPCGITEVDEIVTQKCVTGSGGKYFPVNELMVTAVGAGIAIDNVAGTMLLDIGEGTTKTAVFSSSGIVCSSFTKVAGRYMDEAICDYVRAVHNLLVGSLTANHIKHKVGSAYTSEDVLQITIKGRSVLDGMIKECKLTNHEILSALQNPLEKILDLVKKILSDVPPELSADLKDNGIIIAGGGALLGGLDRFLMKEVGIPVAIADDPLTCISRGSNKLLALEKESN